MTRSTYPLKLADSVKREAQRRAKEDGVSLNHWLSNAVAKELGAVETASEFLKRRAEGGSPEEFIRLLKESPNTPPMPGDEID